MLRIGSRKTDPDDTPKFESAGSIVRRVYATVVLLVLLAGGYWACKPLLFLEGEGTVEAPSIEISVPYLANVKFITVRAGQHVYPGAVLAVVSHADANDVLRGLSARLHAAKLKDLDLRSRLSRARHTLAPAKQQAKETAKRLSLLQNDYRDYLTSPHLATLQREQIQAATTLASIEADLEILPQELDEVDREIRTVSVEMADVERDWGHILLAAPKEGHIGPELTGEGGTVTPGKALMTLYDTSRAYVLWRLPAFFLVQPKVGDSVDITHGRFTTSGRIRRILAVTEQSKDLLKYEQGRLAEIEIVSGADQLPLRARVVVRRGYL